MANIATAVFLANEVIIPIGRLLRLLHEERVDDILRRAGVGAGHPSPAEAHETIRAFRARMPWLALVRKEL